MTIRERITLKRKITEIALNEAIRGWQPPVSGQLHCPFCQSDRVYRRMQRKNGMTHVCKGCEQSFSEELMKQCRCIRPGKFAKCLSCPQYQRIRELMKFNIEQLRYLPETQVDQILKHPDFYQENFSLQQVLPQVSLKHFAKCKTTGNSGMINNLHEPIADANVDATLEQLSLFE